MLSPLIAILFANAFPVLSQSVIHSLFYSSFYTAIRP